MCVFGRGFGGAPGRQRTPLLSPEGRAFARVFSADSCVFSAGQEGGQERGGSFINRHWRGSGETADHSFVKRALRLSQEKAVFVIGELDHFSLPQAISEGCPEARCTEENA